MDERTELATDSWKTLIIKATAAQFAAVLLAALGCFGVLWSVDKGWVRWCGILIPFLPALAIIALGFIVYFRSLIKKCEVSERMYRIIVLLCLYVDAVMLSIMVGFSGGVKQSLFCPLFFAIPAMAIVFVPWREEYKHIWRVAVVTVVCYLVVYWLLPLLGLYFPRWLPHLFPPAVGTPKLFYNICECIVLAGSVGLTVLMSWLVPRIP